MTTKPDDWTERFARMAREQDEILALRAELEHERAERDLDIASAGQECERLQIERDALRAENERLRADQRYLDESVRNQAIRETIHKEELIRLRAALRQIASASDWHPDDMQNRARAALGSDKEC